MLPDWWPPILPSPGLERSWVADRWEGWEWHQGIGHTPMGQRYRDDQTEGRVGHRSTAEVHSYPPQQRDTDCQLVQGVHIETVAPEGRRVAPACSVEA